MTVFPSFAATWERWRTSFHAKVLATIVLASMFMIAAFYLVSQAIGQVKQTANWTRHSLEVRLNLRDLERSLIEAESDARGYLLTSSPTYLDGYRDMMALIDREVAALRSFTADSEIQQAYAGRLAAQFHRWKSELDRSVENRDGSEPAIAAALTTMQTLREIVAQMDSNEARLLSTRTVLEERSLGRNFWFTVALCAVTLALAAVVYLLVLRESSLRTKAAAEREVLNASLEARVIQSTRELRSANEALRRENKQREQAEVELQKSYELLEARVRERTAELIEANSDKTRFLSAASHDLRQPLHSLVLLNATLRGQKLDQASREIVDAQHQALQGMSNLVHSLLSISMLEAGVVHPQIMNVPIRNVLGPLRAEFTPLAEAKGLALSVEPTEDVVRSDLTMLREVIQNLVANAIRYTQQGSVRVYAQRTSQSMRIVVSDTGPGIPKDQLDRIFDEFHQLTPSPGREREGFGLGLSIVKRLVNVLGLELDVQSTVGQGTTFVVAVPLGAEAALPIPDSPARAAEHAKGCILLVDDETDVRQATAFFLQLDGHKVVSVGSLAEAIDAMASQDPPVDIIVTDFQLGTAADGADLIHRIRAMRGKDVPAVVLSGDMLGATRKCASISRCKIFNKPVDPEELAAHLETALG